MSEYEVEVVRRVYVNNEGVYLEVGDGPDGMGVCVATRDKKSQEWFGTIELTMDPKLGIKLAEALMAACKERGA